jgi:hypothetical protein
VRLALAVVALVAALALGGSAAALPNVHARAALASDTVISDGDTVFDVVSASVGELSLTAVVLAVDRTTQISVSVPQGYSLDLTRPVGSEVGDLGGSLVDATGGGYTSVDATLVTEDPAKYASNAAAQACAPGTHAAVWSATFPVLGGRSLSLPLFVDSVSGGGYSIRLCPQWTPSADLPAGVSAVSLFLFVEGLRAPQADGAYRWSAIVTPAADGSFEPVSSETRELRVVVPIPHVLTLHARYDAKKKSALLRGRLTAIGRGEAGIPISFGSYTGSEDGFDDFGPVRTDASGAFSIRRPVTATTRFTASVAQLQPHACTSSSTAPGGCVESMARPDGAVANVVLRGLRDPKLQRRKADQARAGRTALKLSDLPQGWQVYAPDPFEPECPRFKPNLSDLTTTGEASSPDLISGKLDAYAYSDVAVYLSAAQALKAFAREAQIGEARCYADAVADANSTVESVARVSSPRFGDQTKVFRVLFTYQGETYVVDFVSLRRGRLVAHFVFAAEDAPFALEQDLLARVATRAGRG